MTEFLSYEAYDAWDDLVEAVRYRILGVGFVTVLGLPTDSAGNSLIRLASSLGKLSLGDVTAPDQGNPYVHNIQARAKPLRDSRGVILSTTSERFPCHTDDYFEERPSDLVFQHCIQPAITGGDSVVATLSDILDVLPAEASNALMLSIFPSPFGLIPILELNNQSWTIRYNRIQMERAASKLDMIFSAEVHAAIDQLDDAIAQTQRKLKLWAGDCLVLNNRTVVHGRTAFPQDSDRLLKRVKAYL
jgi:Taurine catabolism dioxygenase TauD, TfdA family